MMVVVLEATFCQVEVTSLVYFVHVVLMEELLEYCVVVL